MSSPKVSSFVTTVSPYESSPSRVYISKHPPPQSNYPIMALAGASLEDWNKANPHIYIYIYVYVRATLKDDPDDTVNHCSCNRTLVKHTVMCDSSHKDRRPP